ncbi:hypothetical protein GCM10010336_12900 [Streptomyces goshikiensis]|nr:hypothetical protein GCM10010336_12900 [Streptomyces goshikiensis]
MEWAAARIDRTRSASVGRSAAAGVAGAPDMRMRISPSSWASDLGMPNLTYSLRGVYPVPLVSLLG